MGTLICAEWQLHMDDRVLSHLEYVVVQQFRRGDSFLLSWVDADGPDAVERSLWLGPSMAVGFDFDSADAVPLELAWVAGLSSAAGSTEGLRIADSDGRDIPVLTAARA